MGLARRDQGARRRRCRDIGDDERHRARPQPPSARRVAAGRHRFLCPSSSAMHTDISSSSLRELDAVALATNAIISMKRGTKEADRAERCQVVSFRRCSRPRVRNAGYTPRVSAPHRILCSCTCNRTKRPSSSTHSASSRRSSWSQTGENKTVCFPRRPNSRIFVLAQS